MEKGVEVGTAVVGLGAEVSGAKAAMTTGTKLAPKILAASKIVGKANDLIEKIDAAKHQETAKAVEDISKGTDTIDAVHDIHEGITKIGKGNVLSGATDLGKGIVSLGKTM